MGMIAYWALFVLVTNCECGLVDFVFDFFEEKNVRVHFYGCNRNVLWKPLLTRYKNSSWRKLTTYNKTEISDEYCDYYVIDSYHCSSLNILDKFESVGMFSSTKQLIIINEGYFEELNEKLKSCSIFPNSYLVVALVSTSGEVILKQPYKIKRNATIVWQEYGAWNEKNRLTQLYGVAARRRLNFNMASFDVALVLDSEHSWTHLEDYRYPQIDSYTKQNFIAITHLLEICNITYKLSREYNYEHLMNRQNNYLLTASAPYLTKDLVPLMSFVRIQNSPKICFLLKRPPTSFISTIFTDAFDGHVWYAMIATLVLLCFVLYMVLNIEGRRQAIKLQEEFSTFDLALIALEAVCQQGTSTDPRSYSARILEVVMFTAFMFLYVSYSSYILVLLQSTTEIKNTEELIHYGIRFGGMNTSHMTYYQEDTGTNLFGKSINSQQYYTIEEGMQKVRDGLFAFFVESQLGLNYVKEKFTDYEICGVQEVGGRFVMNLGYIGIPKNSPYAEIFKIVLLKIDEFGLQQRHYKRYFPKPRCYSRGSSFDTVGIRETYQAMLLVILGVIMGILVLGLEIFVYKMKRRIENKKARLGNATYKQVSTKNV